MWGLAGLRLWGSGGLPFPSYHGERLLGFIGIMLMEIRDIQPYTVPQTIMDADIPPPHPPFTNRTVVFVMYLFAGFLLALGRAGQGHCGLERKPLLRFRDRCRARVLHLSAAETEGW